MELVRSYFKNLNNLVVITNFLAFLFFYLKIFPSCRSGSRRENKCGSMWIRILKPVSKETRKEFFSFVFHGETNDWQSARRGIIYCFYQETLEVMSVWGEGKGYTTKETNSRSGLYCPDSLAVLWLPHHHIAAKTSGHCFHHHTMLKELSSIISVSDPDSGVFWVRVRNPATRANKKLNIHKLILLFTTFYLSINLFWWEHLINM